MKKQGTIIALIGPTAVGKTQLSIRIARHLGCPVLSADSRQMYRDLRIGTAAPTREEMEGVPHHFLGFLGLEAYFSAAMFQDQALRKAEELFRQHPQIILSGGSMLYVDALLEGIDDIPTVDASTREEIRQYYEQNGLEGLRRMLRLLDPEYYEKVDLRNPRRIIHALEICRMSGKTYTSFRRRVNKERPFGIIRIGLRRERSELFSRISERVDRMMREGLLEEARNLYPYRHLNALNTVGYKELFRYMDGASTLEEAVESIKRNTRVYAKKQMTWFQRNPSIRWFHPESHEEIMAFIRESLEKGDRE